jgi:hypothetical protein
MIFYRGRYMASVQNAESAYRWTFTASRQHKLVLQGVVLCKVYDGRAEWKCVRLGRLLLLAEMRVLREIWALG